MSNLFSHPFEESLKTLRDDLKRLYDERAKIDAQKAANAAEIDKREAAIRALSAVVGVHEIELPAAEIEVVKDYSETLRGLKKRGYGAVTKAVEALLNAEPAGFAARDLRDILLENRVHLNGPDQETPVRSAIKNLRLQGKALYDSETGKYRAVKSHLNV